MGCGNGVTAVVGDIAPHLPLLRRILKHPRLKHYDRLVVLDDVDVSRQQAVVTDTGPFRDRRSSLEFVFEIDPGFASFVTTANHLAFVTRHQLMTR